MRPPLLRRNHSSICYYEIRPMFRIIFILTLVIATACGEGGGSDRSQPQIAWTYRISPQNAGRSRTFTTPAVAPDGTIYFGGALDDASGTACLYALGPDGSLKKTLVGTNGAHRGAPTVWPAIREDDDGAYAVDEDGGLYSMKLNGDDLFRPAPDEAFDHIRWKKDEPRLLGPIFVGERGQVYAGGYGALHVFFIESRSSPHSFRVEAKGKVRPYFWSNGDVRGRGDGLSRALDDGYGRDIGRVDPWRYPQAHAFGPKGRAYTRHRFKITAHRWSFDVEEPTTSDPRVGHGEAVYFTTTRTLHAVEGVGEKLWEFRNLDGGFQTEVALTDESVLVVDTLGRLFSFSPDGKEKWRIQLGEHCATPAVAPTGMLYTACLDGLAYAVRPPTI